MPTKPATAKLKTVIVTLDRVRFTNEGFTVSSARTEKSADELLSDMPAFLTVKLFAGPARTGQRWTLVGDWADDPKYGKQFVGNFAALATPRNNNELLAFLTSGLIEGWGWDNAYNLARVFGDDACRVIAEQPSRLEVEAGVTPFQYEALLDAWARGTGLAPVYSQLTEWGIGSALADRLVKEYKFQTVDVLKKNPYAPIAAVPYYTWRTGEQVAAVLELEDDDPRRVEAGLTEVVRTGATEQGHTWMTNEAALKSAESLLGLDATDIDAILQQALNNDDGTATLVLTKDYRLCPSTLWHAEQAISASIAGRLVQQPIVETDRVETLPLEDGLSEEQRYAVIMALTSPISMLTGGPGTGKSHSLKALVTAAHTLRLDVHLMAPTGKAAQRMTQATNCEASTIHRAFGLKPGQTRISPKVQPLTGLVVVDECFARDTLVDTIHGQRPIQDVRPGDYLFNAAGVAEVIDVSRKEVQHVVRVTANGKSLICSANHPFFTRRGWVAAERLAGETLVAGSAALLLVRGFNPAHKLCTGNEKVLQSLLLSEFADEFTGSKGIDALSGSACQARGQEKHLAAVRSPRSERTDGADSSVKSYAYAGSGGKNIGSVEGKTVARDPRRERQGVSGGTANVADRTGCGLGSRVCSEPGRQTAGVPDVLQTGYSEPLAEVRDRGGRLVSQHKNTQSAGSEEGHQAGYIRVDCVEVLEQGDSSLDSVRDADGKLYFYDLGVARHPSFMVNGLLVHNCSMLDTTVAAALFAGISNRAHVLLVGDPDQLPSVGAGAVLRDILDADVLPRMHLTRVFRNEAGIAVNAAHIRAGEAIQSLPDCKLLSASTAEQAQAKVMDTLDTLTTVGGYTRDDVLVLCPTNDGASGRHALNTRLQAVYNADNEGLGIMQKVDTTAYELRTGDRVIVTKNNTELEVFNGETGRIIQILSPKRLVARIEDREVTFGGADLKNLQLAYAITGHKAQGSEAPVVIIPVFQSRVLSREWLYTVITRARKQVYIIGDPVAVQNCINVVRLAERKTGLFDAIALAVQSEKPEEGYANQWSSSPYAFAANGGCVHTRRPSTSWKTSCGLDTSLPGWTGVHDYMLTDPCKRCLAAYGQVVRPFKGEEE